MAALLGDGLPALRLNDADLQVDRKLPEAKQKSNITPQKDVKENQLKDGAVFRSSKQKEIKATMNDLQGEEHNRKMYVKQTWNSASDLTKQSYLNMISNYNLSEYKNLIDYIKKERAWWKSTYSSGLTVSVLENVFADYSDEVGEKLKRFQDASEENEITNADLLEKRKNATPAGKMNTNIDLDVDWSKLRPESADEAIRAAQEQISEPDPFKRTLWDDVNESWAIIGGFLGILIWIILGLRFGSSIANEYFYLEKWYKILMFVYTIIFTPVLIPYFIYKTIRTFFFPAKYPPVTFRCFLPLFETDDENLAGSWFTYYLKDKTEKTNKLEEINAAKRKVLEKTIMQPLKIDLAKFSFMAAHPAPKDC